MKITLTNLSNSAFGETDTERDLEVARILRHIAHRVEEGQHVKSIYDANGNKVGTIEYGEVE